MAPGPFRADQIREGDPYELSNGHAILCAPSGRRGSRANLVGGESLETDPDVAAAGVDAGFSHKPSHLRAPDIAVGNFSDEPGWAPGAPALAVEYADTGQDEDELQAKIGELLAGGTKHVWVVRLVGPRRVEVHDRGSPMRIALPGDELSAPGILRNAVRIEALYDRDAAHEHTLRNLLQRKGFENLEDVQNRSRAEGELKGRAEALLTLLSARGLRVSKKDRHAILAVGEAAKLDRWIQRAVKATSVEQVLASKAKVRPRRPKR